MSKEGKPIDPTERDLRIAIIQAQGEDAIRAAKEKLESYLNSRLALQLQHSKMAIAAKEADKRIIQGINSD